ncbi:unnamed protein product [Rotaria socialis]|uniref:C2H2-type domain-containing protein n=2 Tax=Rotaria socialis TaxID=392032 RepID=A0A817SK02_9BILA|nr:unnamed protein product [Rotaria socialis]
MIRDATNLDPTDRQYHNLGICPVAGCQSSFESTEDLGLHIAANIHNIFEEEHQTSNDIVRLHLIETVRSTITSTISQTTKLFEDQLTQHTSFNQSPSCRYFSYAVWALRKRKHNNPLTKKVKDYIEKRWIESQDNNTKASVGQIQNEIRTLRSNTGSNMCETCEYPTLNQVKYQCRTLTKKYELHTRQQLIEELAEDGIETIK